MRGRNADVYQECFRGTNLRRTEIACAAWAITIWSGSSFANHPSYFFVQAGMTAQQAISMDLGIRGVAFVATFVAWINLTVCPSPLPIPHIGAENVVLWPPDTLCQRAVWSLLHVCLLHLQFRRADL